MFKADINIKLSHEVYDDGTYKIKEAGVCDIYDIGGKPGIYDVDITSYMCSDEIQYYYYLDYVIFVEKYIMGYFIGDVGYNFIDTPISKKEDKVYYLMDICMYDIIEENIETHEFKLMLQYLYRHCKNNNCKVLQLKLDHRNRYELFYENLKINHNFIEFNGYLLKQIN